MMAPTLLVSQDWLQLTIIFVLQYVFYDYFLKKSVKNAIGILIQIAMNLQIVLGNMNILTMLIILIHKHGISFHLSVLSSVSFLIVLQFLVYSSFTSLVKFFLSIMFFFFLIEIWLKNQFHLIEIWLKNMCQSLLYTK